VSSATGPAACDLRFKAFSSQLGEVHLCGTAGGLDALDAFAKDLDRESAELIGVDEAIALAIRQRVTKGAGSRKRGLTMAFKLLEMAQLRWRRLNGAALLPLVRAGVPFKDGEKIERDDQSIVDKGAEAAA